MSKPRIFVGSSTEGLPIAEAIQQNLEYVADVLIWSQGAISLSESILESLEKLKGTVDFAILVLTPDDLREMRGEAKMAPRDNVLFELGYFMALLGRRATFFVYNRDNPPALPSDLAGVTAATYSPRDDGNLTAALGGACTKIKRAIDSIDI